MSGGSGTGIEGFERILANDGYRQTQQRQFTGETLSLYHLTQNSITSVAIPSDGATVSGSALLDAVVKSSTNVRTRCV